MFFSGKLFCMHKPCNAREATSFTVSTTVKKIMMIPVDDFRTVCKKGKDFLKWFVKSIIAETSEQ